MDLELDLDGLNLAELPKDELTKFDDTEAGDIAGDRGGNRNEFKF